MYIPCVKNILLIDNDDSFTANLEHLLVLTLGVIPKVIPYAAIAEAENEPCDMLVISPGPGKPSEYPDYASLLSRDFPILGICLGMQIINDFFGGRTDRLADCIHGKTDDIEFDGKTVTVARYHSLYASRVAPCLKIIAVNEAGVPMAIRHKSRPILGYQFHPESFMTTQGKAFIDYALRLFKTCTV